MSSIIFHSINVGVCLTVIVAIFVYSLYCVYHEFKKPVDKQKQALRMAELEAKRRRWEAYFEKK